MTEAYVPFINTLISSGVSLAVAFGTWHITMKKDREKQTEEVKQVLDDHREEYLSGIQDVKNEVASVKAAMELNQAVTNQKIDTLSADVGKHNGVLERTYRIEEQVKSMDHRIDNLENK